MIKLGRSQDAYDRFCAAVEVPLLVLAVFWLPVLVIPLVARLPAGVAGTFDTIDYLVWAVFVAEYLIKLYLAPSRWTFFRRHPIDLLVIAVPVLRPLRLLRLLRLLTFARAGLTMSSALKRARNLLTHNGLHFVLLPVTRCGGRSSPLPRWVTATSTRLRPAAGAWPWSSCSPASAWSACCPPPWRAISSASRPKTT